MWSRINHDLRARENLKKDPEKYKRYLISRNKSSKKWWQKNKDKMMEYQKDMRQIDREIGNCTQCHKERDNPKYRLCSKCRVYHRMKLAEYKKKKK